MCVVVSYGPPNELPLARTPNPAAVPATCEPWPLQSSGFGSGCGMVAGSPSGALALKSSPTRSVPPLTFAASGPKSAGFAGTVSAASAAAYSAGVATVPGARKLPCVKSIPVSMIAIFWLRPR